MASKSTSKSVSLKRLPVPASVEPKEFRITIDLTRTEAEDILALCDYIGGNPRETRGVFDGIGDALIAQGVKRTPNGKAFIEENNENCRANGLGFHFTERINRPKYPVRED